MLLLKKFSFFVLVVFINLINLAYQEELAGIENLEDLSELSFEGSADSPNSTTTIIDDYESSTAQDITAQDTTVQDTTVPDIKNPPQTASTKSNTGSTAQSASSLPIVRSTPRINISTTLTITSPKNVSSRPMVSSTPISISTTDVKPMVKCNAEGKNNGQYDIENWPSVEAGQNSLANCPHGHGMASWKCLESGEFDEKGPDVSNCTDWLDDLGVGISDLEHVAQAIEVIEFISNKTVRNDTIKKSEKLSQCLDIISKVQTIVNNANDTDLEKLEKYANNVFETFTHILDQKEAWVSSNTSEKTALASKILIGTQSSIYSLSLQQNLNNSFVEILNNDFYINTFYTNPSFELKFPVKGWDSNSSSIIIPPNTRFLNNSTERNNTAIGAIIRNLNQHMTENMEENHEINSNILSFSLANISERVLLNQDVTITLKHKHRLQLGDEVDCVFWDFNQSKWSSEGCYKLTNESDLLHTVCKCNHLTNFAALMDVNGRESKTLLKSLLTYFCSVISILGLIVTINLIIRSKNKQNVSIRGNLNEMRSIITCNLCICLMLTNILVIAGMDRTDILWLCQMSSALLLYSLLSSFSWMLMEGYYLYKSLVSCFNAEYKASYLYLFGYGLPIAIFMFAFIVIYIKENILLEALFDERYNYFCWISSTYYTNHIWILIGPAVCVIVCNCILMFISLRTAFRILRNQSSFGGNVDKTNIKFRQIISFVFLLFMLGITWLSFLLYINQLCAFVFAYVFIVLNGSQGFFIFLYHLSIYDFRGNRRVSDSVNSSHSSQTKLDI